MLKIVDHAYEPEKVLADNHAKVLAAMKRGEDVLIYHSKGFVHRRLANLPGVRYEVLAALPRRRDVNPKKLSSSAQPCISVQDKELLSRFIQRRDAAFLARFYEEYEAFMAAYAKNNGLLESSEI